MKLIDALLNVEREETDKSRWHYSAPSDPINSALGISDPDYYPDELDLRLRAYPVFNWLCTDEHVGLDALYLDGELVASIFRPARKSDYSVKWVSRELAQKVREVILSYAEEPEQGYDLIDPNEEIEDAFTVQYVGQSLTDDGFFEGRPVRALVWYDGLMGRTTPPEYRREGHSYTVAVPYKDARSNCVLVQDGDEQRLIPVTEFRMPFRLKQS